MVMLAKVTIKVDVNDETEAREIETIAATAVAHYMRISGHPGNATAVLDSVLPNCEVAGPQCQSQS